VKNKIIKLDKLLDQSSQLLQHQRDNNSFASNSSFNPVTIEEGGKSTIREKSERARNMPLQIENINPGKELKELL